jgi:DNA-binding ferritin-like protein
MFDSPTPRPEAIRAAGAELLGPLVLNGKALLLAVHFAHVNTRGKAFGPIHAILGEVYDALTTFTDDLAERIATLGGTAPGTLEQVAAGATLTPYPVKTVQDFDHVREVYSRLATWNAPLTTPGIRGFSTTSPAARHLGGRPHANLRSFFSEFRHGGRRTNGSCSGALYSLRFERENDIRRRQRRLFACVLLQNIAKSLLCKAREHDYLRRARSSARALVSTTAAVFEGSAGCSYRPRAWASLITSSAEL